MKLFPLTFDRAKSKIDEANRKLDTLNDKVKVIDEKMCVHPFCKTGPAC